jgi:hypothetical protein
VGNGEPSADLLRSLGERFQNVTFGDGIVSKTTRAILGLTAIWLAIIFKLSGNLVLDVALFFSGGAITWVTVWWIRRTHAFAEKNPLQALLSGSQFVEYHRFEAQTKGLPNPGSGPLIAGGANLPAAQSGDPQKEDRE